MNWIDNVVRPKIRSFLNRREVEDNLWVKCPESGEMVFHRDLEANQWVVPNSGYHMKIKPADRLAHFFDDGQYTKLSLPSVAQDPLKFRDTKRYTDRLKEARTKTGQDDAIVAPVREASAEMGFQIPELARHGGVGNAQLASGSRKCPGAFERCDDGQVRWLH